MAGGVECALISESHAAMEVHSVSSSKRCTATDVPSFDRLALISESHAVMETSEVSPYSFLGTPRCCESSTSSAGPFSWNYQWWARQALLAALVLDVLMRHGAKPSMRVKLGVLLGAWLMHRILSQQVQDRLPPVAAFLRAANVRRWTWIWAKLPEVRLRQLRQVFMALLSIDALLSSAGNAAASNIAVAAGLAGTAWLARRQLSAACGRLWAILPQPNRRGLHRAMLVALILEALPCLVRQAMLLLQAAIVILGLLAAFRLSKEVAFVDGLRALIFLLQDWVSQLRASTASFHLQAEDPWKPYNAFQASQNEMSYFSSAAFTGLTTPATDRFASPGIVEFVGSLGDRSWVPSLPIPASAMKHSAAGVASAARDLTVAGVGAAASCSVALGSFAAAAGSRADAKSLAVPLQAFARAAAVRSVELADASVKVGMATLSSLKASRLAASKQVSSKASTMRAHWQKRQRQTPKVGKGGSEPNSVKATCTKAPHDPRVEEGVRKKAMIAEAQLSKKGSQKRELPLPTDEQAPFAAAFVAAQKRRKISNCAAAIARELWSVAESGRFHL